MKTFVALLVILSSACKSDNAPASAPPPPAPTAKVVEPAVAPAPAPAPTATPVATKRPSLNGVHVGSTGDDVDEKLLQKSDKWIAQRTCDSCLDGDYLYGDIDDPQMTITVKKNVVTDIVDHSFAALTDVANEPVGPIALDMTAKLVEKALGAPTKKSSLEYRGEFDRYESTWEYPGLTLSLAAKTQKNVQHVSSISVSAPSTLKTKRGIGIGSTRADADKAYADAKTSEPLGAGMWIAGEPTGGSVSLGFTDDKVTSIQIDVLKGE